MYQIDEPDDSDVPFPIREVTEEQYRVSRSTELHNFTAEQQETFLQVLSEQNRQYQAAAVAGISVFTVRNHMRSNPEFAARVREAQAQYQDRLMSLHHKRLNGVLEPVIGRIGKDEDGVITHVRKYSDALHMAELKRHFPEYREPGAQVNVTLPGVLVLPSIPRSTDEWEKLAAEYKPPVNPLEGLPGVQPDLLEAPKESDQ